MPTNKKRVLFYADASLVDALQKRSIEDGESVGAVIRRTLRLGLFADAQKIERRGSQSTLLIPRT